VYANVTECCLLLSRLSWLPARDRPRRPDPEPRRDILVLCALMTAPAISAQIERLPPSQSAPPRRKARMMHAQPQRGRPKSRARTACPTHEPRCAKDQPSAVYAQRAVTTPASRAAMICVPWWRAAARNCQLLARGELCDGAHSQLGRFVSTARTKVVGLAGFSEQ
jgi:hypothetical protein